MVDTEFYKKWVEYDWWLLEEAIDLIFGEEIKRVWQLSPAFKTSCSEIITKDGKVIQGAWTPIYPLDSTEQALTGFKDLCLYLVGSKSSQDIYNKAIDAINNQQIISEEAVAFSYKDTQIPIRYRELHLVNPRSFIKWAIKEKEHIEPDLLQFFNYEYWVSLEKWTFDEMVYIATMPECPLPNEIGNSFIVNKTKNNAKLLKTAIGNASHNDSFTINKACHIIKKSKIILNQSLQEKLINYKAPSSKKQRLKYIQELITAIKSKDKEFNEEEINQFNKLNFFDLLERIYKLPNIGANTYSGYIGGNSPAGLHISFNKGIRSSDYLKELFPESYS